MHLCNKLQLICKYLPISMHLRLNMIFFSLIYPHTLSQLLKNMHLFIKLQLIYKYLPNSQASEITYDFFSQISPPSKTTIGKESTSYE